MNDAEFELLDRIEDGHWWFVGKRSILRAILSREAPPRRLLDLGCGTGGVLRDWSEECSCYGTDASPAGLRVCARKGMRNLVRSDLRAAPFAPHSFDAVLALDVIEHLDEDVAFLRSARRLCQPGGRIVVAVPAFQALWSAHDETFQHRRRYTSRQLEAVLSQAGFEPERTTYAHCLVFPIAAAWRILSSRTSLRRFAPRHDFWPIPRLLNDALVRVYRLEAWLLGRLRLPFGVSAVCVARAPAQLEEPM
ncbi:MAG: methyltransferase domain-containing protein [Myxococcota bacterium]